MNTISQTKKHTQFPDINRGFSDKVEMLQKNINRARIISE